MSFTSEANQIFNRAINDYHLTDNVNTPMKNPYTKDSIQYSLYGHQGATANANSIMAYLQKYNATMATDLKAKLDPSAI